MLSYRHAFHAGNHADVLKHAALSLLVRAMCRKDKPFTYYESHSGGGLYELDSEWSRQTGEADAGIMRVLQAEGAPLSLAPWLNLVRDMVENHRRYPGSPELVRELSRDDDELVLMELHPTEVEILREHMKIDPRVHVHHRDGLEGLLALCPPKSRRGMVLMDPSFEGGADYTNAVDCLRNLHRKWPEGVFALWYPILGQGRDRSGELKANLERHPFKGMFTLEVLVKDPKAEPGMVGSGFLVANPPWKLDEEIRATMPWLMKSLNAGRQASWKFSWLIDPS